MNAADLVVGRLYWIEGNARLVNYTNRTLWVQSEAKLLDVRSDGRCEVAIRGSGHWSGSCAVIDAAAIITPAASRRQKRRVERGRMKSVADDLNCHYTLHSDGTVSLWGLSEAAMVRLERLAGD